jgi:hypothetical protein
MYKLFSFVLLSLILLIIIKSECIGNDTYGLFLNYNPLKHNPHINYIDNPVLIVHSQFNNSITCILLDINNHNTIVYSLVIIQHIVIQVMGKNGRMNAIL